MEPIRILFIDSYDSFTYNVVRLIEEQATNTRPVEVFTIHNDTFANIETVLLYLPLLDGGVIGPGPGNPVHGFKSVGIIDSLFKDQRLNNFPILGICLGFQAMCFSQGASVEELDTIKHGQVYPIKLNTENKDPIFKEYPRDFKSTRYHSLHVTNFDNIKSITPLAYTEDENGILLMGARIGSKPWYGVQYHPESCCSEFGAKLIQNFLDIIHSNVKDKYDLSELSKEDQTKLFDLQKTIDISPICEPLTNKPNDPFTIKSFDVSQDPQLTFKICDKIKGDKFIMASSAVSANRGEWSIIAIPSRDSTVLSHYGAIEKTTIYKWQDESLHSKQVISGLKTVDAIHQENLNIINENKESFWHTLGEFMKEKFIKKHDNLPFIGGLVGILGYEMGSFVHFNSSSTTTTFDKLPKPDAKLVYIENSVLINHQTGKLYLCSLCGEFPEDISELINSILGEEHTIQLNWEDTLPNDISYDIIMPNKEDYATAFDKCQEYMHRGDSYEICLTTQTIVTPSKRLPAWRIFKTLIKRNPAPFSSFFYFNDILDNSHDILSFISTSPERFLKWDNNGCELRPIKGTVRKSEEMSVEKATEILKSPKEFGENLMILDLIRNDLYELLPDVKVEEFMSVEEYKTVYQLVSVVKAYNLNKSMYTGIDVLKYSLPPGSMTGAPKKITVELLQDDIEKTLNKHIDNGSRGIYSGVTGYWSANGNGDWSVNIRCMYSYDNGDHWKLGAGGAITVLSTQEGELDEMYAKLESALQVFM